MIYCVLTGSSVKKRSSRDPGCDVGRELGAFTLAFALLTCQFDVHVHVQQQVLGLEVSVDDVVAVAVLDGCEDLPELLARLGFAHASVRGQVVCRGRGRGNMKTRNDKRNQFCEKMAVKDQS